MQLAPTSARKEVDIGTMWMDSRSSVVVIGCLYRFFYSRFFTQRTLVIAYRKAGPTRIRTKSDV